MCWDTLHRIGDVGRSDGIPLSRQWTLAARSPCLGHLYSGFVAGWTMWVDTIALHFWVVTFSLLFQEVVN